MQAERDRAQMDNEMALEQFRTEEETRRQLAKAQIDQQTQITTAQIKAESAAIAALSKPEPSHGQD